MRYDTISPIPQITRATKFLVLTCVIIFFIDFFLFHLKISIFGLSFSDIFGLVPGLVKEKLWAWQFFTYQFLHGNPLHLLLNMLILWYFGSEIEVRLGEKEFLIYYFTCAIGAGLFNFGVNLFFSDPSHLYYPIIGASGAIYGLLAAYGVFFANRYFLVFFLFPMKAKYFVLLMAAIELIMGVDSRGQDNIAHFAHLGGMLIGAIYIYFRWIRPARRGPKRDAEKDRLKKQFTLIVNQNNPGGKPDPNNKDFWN